MKLLLSFMILLALQRCTDEGTQEKDKFALQVNETIDAGGIKLQLLAIEDSRCPKGVKCVWAGAAVTTIVVQGPSLQDTLQFCLGTCHQNAPSGGGTSSDTITVKGQQYALSLLEVNPYPGTGSEGTEKTALYSFNELP